MSAEPANRHASRLLLVDDEPHILKALTRLLHSDGYLIDTATNGEDAIEYARTQEYATIICDQRMPGMSGSQVLREVNKLLPHATRITLTGYTDIESAISSVNEGGVQYFLLKPWENDHLRDIVKRSCEQHRTKMALRMAQATVLSQRNQLAELNASLEARVLERTTDLVHAQEETRRALVLALDARERKTAGHSWRVAVFTVRLAIAHGLPTQDLEKVYLGAMLHDIGKIGVPDNILLKPGSLTPDEVEIMQGHVHIGATILGDIAHLRSATQIPLFHHEKFDGTGYPNAMSGYDIPLDARLFALIDVYDALTNERCYKAALTHEEATAIIEEGCGSHFDPEIVNTFLSIPPSDWQVLHHTATCLGGLHDVISACQVLIDLPPQQMTA